MRMSYYPGCSMGSIAVSYAKSLLAVAEALGLRLEEIPDWNCCGASIASGVAGGFVQQVLVARNLALAEEMKQDVLVACSSCYLNLATTNSRLQQDSLYAGRVNKALAVGGLHYSGSVRVRRAIDVMLGEIGPERIESRVQVPLKGLKVAGYLGCQTMRAHPGEFDQAESPKGLDRLIKALGAESVNFTRQTTCCGSSHVVPASEVVTRQVKEILASAVEGGADIIVTLCPLCQLNLETHQEKVNEIFGTDYEIPVLFFTQLMAYAFGLPSNTWGFEHMLISPKMPAPASA
ncbi:lactate utilization protein A [Peptococcaceae bacterium CEB3]|nr:lactate utilization protein A [Peptococcaceae bacterium CEB3]